MYVKNKKISIPQVKMVERDFNKRIFTNARFIGLSPIAAKILANRKVPEDPEELKKIINPTFKNVNIDIYKLKDIKKSADRIADAIINGETIGLLCDFDVDGISSAAVLYSAFIDYFNYEPYKLKMLISHRMMHGYGFREEVLENILEMQEKPTLLITADQGSSDEERISDYNQKMGELGFDTHDVIVTDHHHISANGPKSAYAVVNPQQANCDFEDDTICGCTVALFVMIATRDSLIEKGHLPADSPKLTNLITYSTAATIADCVSMASPLNRAIVKKGLHDIDQETIPAWSIMKEVIVGDDRKLSTDSIGFGLGPRINACSRTGGDGLVALKYYLAEDKGEALLHLNSLTNMNEDRKKIEKELVLNALLQASELYEKGYYSLVIYLPDGHHGIHGIAASKVSEKYGRPVIIFSPKTFEEIKTQKNKKTVITKNVFTISGSGRSIEGLSIYDMLVNCEKKDPDLFLGYGGHDMAAGMAINLENFEKLRESFEIEVKKELKEMPVPIVYTDGTLKDNLNINFDLLDEISVLEPYGNNFEQPIFRARVNIIDSKVVGATQETLKVSFVHNNFQYTGMIFKYPLHPMYKKIEHNKVYDIAFTLNEGFFRGNRQLNIFINHLIPV